MSAAPRPVTGTTDELPEVDTVPADELPAQPPAEAPEDEDTPR